MKAAIAIQSLSIIVLSVCSIMEHRIARRNAALAREAVNVAANATELLESHTGQFEDMLIAWQRHYRESVDNYNRLLSVLAADGWGGLRVETNGALQFVTFTPEYSERLSPAAPRYAQSVTNIQVQFTLDAK